jgi:hypothetical protein
MLCWGIDSSGRSADPKAATTLDCAPFIFAHPAPYAGVLSRLECPREAFLGHRAPPAHGLGLLDLQERRTTRPDREEQLGVLVAADRIVTPVHGGKLLVSDGVMKTVLFTYMRAQWSATACVRTLTDASASFCVRCCLALLD